MLKEGDICAPKNREKCAIFAKNEDAKYIKITEVAEPSSCCIWKYYYSFLNKFYKEIRGESCNCFEDEDLILIFSKRSDNKTINKSKTNMQELTPKVIQSFSPEERLLFRAGLLNEEKNWTELARGFAIDLILNKEKKDIVKLAQELIDEERENMLGGLLQKKVIKE